MKTTFYTLLIVSAFASSCTNFEDAELTERKGFIRFYSSGSNFQGVVVEEDADGGLIIGSNIPRGADNFNAYIIKTDARGNKVWERVIESTKVSSILPYSNGYFILGDSIEIKQGDIPSEFVNTRARLLFMDNLGNMNPNEFHRRENFPRNAFQGDQVRLEVDYHGDALSLKNDTLLVLGSFRVPGENARSFVSAVSTANLSTAPHWTRAYGLQDRDYVNCNSLFVTSNTAKPKLIWASKTFKEVQDLSREYVSVSYVEPNSTFENNSLFGQSDAVNFTVEDFEKSMVGFAIVGTSVSAAGTDHKLFFTRVDNFGNVVPGSERYFDAGAETLEVEKESVDAGSRGTLGNALTFTGDGYVLAGTMNSTLTKGAGLSDIVLIKIDPFGKPLWTRLIGGTGAETANSIRTMSDGSLVICGTNTINGLSSVMVVKTDANGSLTN